MPLQLRSNSLGLPKTAVLLLPLAWLWYRLIDHLRIEWSVNPQYSYGYAVPFLCLVLLWQRLRGDRREKGQRKASGRASEVSAFMNSGWGVAVGIGRAACGGREERSGGGVSFKKK